jgi:hypothetical protein
MPAYPAAARRSPVNLAFNALLFSFLGWLILERWNLGAHAGAVPHLVNTLACAPIMACSLRHFYLACPRHLRTSARRPGASPAGRAALAALFAVGALFGLAAGGGSMTLVVLLAAACCFTPWMRIRAHQQHLFLSLLAVAAGAAAVAAAALALNPGFPRREASLMAVLPAASCLWGAAAALCIGLCGGELLKKRKH